MLPFIKFKYIFICCFETDIEYFISSVVNVFTFYVILMASGEMFDIIYYLLKLYTDMKFIFPFVFTFYVMPQPCIKQFLIHITRFW